VSNVSDLVSNRKAFHDYEILETFEAGILLMGTEVKSLRAHSGNLQDAYILVSGTVAVLKNCSIAPYAQGITFGHEEKRERKLLLHKRELARLEKAGQEKGLAIIPLAFYLKGGIIKVKIAIAKGRKTYDKRAALKKKEQEGDIKRAMKQ
jgi:SsrA-binding protein